ncbi:DUF4835 family protein [Cytophaga hutchinsonii]|jgi:hypothetical protein|uniref:DUF4835 domain-containing protein n=1 Tax=Cytophaga hutchinsonii (strain ATCC 33406 / DSM 1761 / CIP 103989 / NBRC 15051 / NCIMB 9469 / D465) TaxID=269798 RepID=A0A6N4SUT8_CYTH3|nr:DUF4835 family protein [Cytophaga hutchinsonii]ABG60255.1 conserved hypothetical protein [Cytophaga hutchinsonii ATCC 33406]SFX20678.1 protein of unknown function [Cytophaga hutchinsonii ATCC 33406]
MKKLVPVIISFFFILSVAHVYAQGELYMNVTIDASQIPDIQESVVTDMKQTITRFLNDRKWTNDEFQVEERIRGNISITITGQPAPYSYAATLQVQSSRPVYGTSYETILLNYFDKNFNFELNIGEPLNYNDNMFTSNLTSMLAFYANIILALDYDSFGKLGGQTYVEKAYNIANISLQAGGGWSQSGDANNRAALIENLNSQLLLPFRQNFYNYHRLGLDIYLSDPAKARLQIVGMFKALNEVIKLKPYSTLIRSFFLAKRDEIINIFRDADTEQKNEVVNLLRVLDPLNSERYATILR